MAAWWGEDAVSRVKTVGLYCTDGGGYNCTRTRVQISWVTQGEMGNNNFGISWVNLYIMDRLPSGCLRSIVCMILGKQWFHRPQTFLSLHLLFSYFILTTMVHKIWWKFLKDGTWKRLYLYLNNFQSLGFRSVPKSLKFSSQNFVNTTRDMGYGMEIQIETLRCCQLVTSKKTGVVLYRLRES